MPKDENEWYVTDKDNPRFVEDIVRTLKEYHEGGAHLYALEKLLESQDFSKEDTELWRAVLTKLDKQGEAK